MMIKHILFAAALAAVPVTAFAQSGPTSGPVIRDPAGGSTRDPALAGGSLDTAGPFASPPLTRDPAGGTMIDDNAGFRQYVMARHYRSFTYDEPLEVGAVLPSRGVTYYAVPARYGAHGYRYTVVNDQPVVVEPRSRRVIEVIE